MSPEPDRRLATRQIVAQIALELITVFIGVTLAFAFDSYRQGVVQERRQHALEQALVKDLQNYEAGGSAYVSSLRKGLQNFDAMRAAGKRPSPFFFRINGAERPPTDVWQAAMQSGAGELLDPDVMIMLAGFYNEISGEESKYARYATFTEQQIFPILESDTTAFYDARTGDLKPEFKGHMRQLGELMADLDDQVKRARTVRDTLSARLK